MNGSPATNGVASSGGECTAGHGVVLQAERLTKRFGTLTAVDGLSLSVNEGEILGFLGPNGAGKTTAIGMLCGLLRPDAGRVLVNGLPIVGGGADVRSRVGVCPQEVVLWEKLTCLEQLQFVGEMYDMPGGAARRRGADLLRDMDLEDKAGALAPTLSGGMKRRLNLALALVHDPQIVVLDEPEAGLDPQSRVMVREYIRSLARRKTVIMTSHNMDEADRVADRVAIIDRGRLLVLDTPEALKSSVGEGDVLEIDLGAAPERAGGALAFLQGRATAEHTDHELVVRALDAVALLPDIVRALADAGCEPGAVHIRQNTLEDVFINLTGRRLRS